MFDLPKILLFTFHVPFQIGMMFMIFPKRFLIVCGAVTFHVIHSLHLESSSKWKAFTAQVSGSLAAKFTACIVCSTGEECLGEMILGDVGPWKLGLFT